MIIPIWGAAYIERWMALSFASLCSAGNIFYVNERCDLELVILTMAADAARMTDDGLFERVTPGLRVKFMPIDELFPKNERIPYGIPLTLAYAKAIADLPESALGTYILMINADFILAEGSLKSVVDRIEQGYGIVLGPSIRVIDGAARRLLEERVDPNSGALSISPRDGMKIVNAHLHNTECARMVNELPFVDSTYYHQIYWRVSPDCFVARCFLVMPLCFRLDRTMQKAFCPVDYGFVREICPAGRFTILADSDDFLMIELQERDSESRLLRIAPKSGDLDERLSTLRPEIALQAANWTTADHRRNAAWTLYFHANDLPGDITERLGPLNDFVDQILAAMPPPVSHIRHYHWLSQIGYYRHRMVRAVGRVQTDLLDDPRNSLRPSIAELTGSSRASGGLSRRLLRALAECVMIGVAWPWYWLRYARRPLSPTTRRAT